jgi:hypothetical protein
MCGLNPSRFSSLPRSRNPVLDRDVFSLSTEGFARMWCPNCQSDVAAEVAADNRRIHCATCGRDIGTSQAASATTRTREARDLLERWSNGSLLQPLDPLPELRAPAGEVFSERDDAASAAREVDNSLESPDFRFDRSHVPQVPGDAEPRRPSAAKIHATDGSPIAFSGRGEEFRRDARATVQAPPKWAAAIPEPHFDVRPHFEPHQPRGSNWASTIGQLVAYAGIGLLTVGTTLVLWGHFGGPASYAPTGWLVSTVGQMFLFLGVLTLVSSGLEQTTAEVARRIDALGEKLFCAELDSRELSRGPAPAIERFADHVPRLRAGMSGYDRRAS